MKCPKFALRPIALISNLSPSTSEGTHWIAVWLSEDRRGEYFDSYGRRPDIHFETYLNREADAGWVSNSRPVQSRHSTLCGAFCLQFLEARSQLPNVRFVELLEHLFPFSSPNDNDRLVQQRMNNHYGIRIPIFDNSLMLKRGLGSNGI